MPIQMIMSEPTLVYSPPVNEATQRWGVYSIPRLWRDISGRLVVRFNGEQDCADLENMQRAPNLFFVSDDEGESWHESEHEYDISILQGIGSPYLRRRCGEILAFREDPGNRPVSGVPFRKEFSHPNGEAVLHTYRWEDIPPECRRFELLRRRSPDSIPEILQTDIGFGSRELAVNALALTDSGDYVPVSEYLKPFIFKNPYLSSPVELPDGCIAAVCFGQSPNVADRWCSEVYLMESADGVLWKKRGDIAKITGELEALSLPFGYGGDGGEVSLAAAPDGELLCAMRMDMSINPDIAIPFCGTMLSRSTDGGYTWTKPLPVSDSSVTPHVIALKNGITAVIYGRPGVHMICSADNMRSFSEPYSIIGRTLWQERRSGHRDSDSKYFNPVSYCNTFVEIISEDSFIILYNDLKYTDSDGRCHKAAFTRRITLLPH